MKDFLSVSGKFSSETVIERSRFICNITHVASEEEARAFIDEIRKEYGLATHNCYAYIADVLGNVCRYSDDGEPQGTAGIPMLEVLKNKNLKCVCAVVTRYFGGIKLGAGGLVRAYGGAVADCLSKGVITNNYPAVDYTFKLNYDEYSLIMKFASANGYAVTNSKFDMVVEVTLTVKAEEGESLLSKYVEFFHKEPNYSKGEEYYLEEKLK